MKSFDYNNISESTKTVANEIISLLNEYNLEENYISIILERVTEAIDESTHYSKLNINKV